MGLVEHIDLRLEPLAGRVPASADEVLEAICGTARSFIEELATSPEDDQITTDYIMGVSDDSEFDGTTLSLRFRDAGGLCAMACYACRHWFELVLTRISIDERLAALGYRLSEPPLALAEAMRPDPFFTYLAETVVAVRRDGDGAFELWADSGYKIPSWDELSPAERALIETLAAERRCGCSLCAVFSQD